MTLDTSEDCDAMVSLDVPQPEVVVFGDGEEEVGVLRVELQLVDALTVAHEVLDTAHRCRAEDPYHSPESQPHQV